MTMTNFSASALLLDEAVNGLNIKPSGIDSTFGVWRALSSIFIAIR